MRGIHRWLVNSPHKRASNVENVSIWWLHHDTGLSKRTWFTSITVTAQGVWNHQKRDSLFNSLFRLTKRKLRISDRCLLVTGGLPSQWPVIEKAFSFNHRISPFYWKQIQCGAIITRSIFSKNSHKSHPITSLSTTAVVNAISCYIGSRYNGTRLYMYITMIILSAISHSETYSSLEFVC